MRIYDSLRKLAKTSEALNIFLASKEIHGIHIFKNVDDFSRIQEMYLNYLYFYSAINMDIALKKVSKKVLNCDIYEDSYILWKREHQEKDESKDNKKRDLQIVFDNKR